MINLIHVNPFDYDILLSKFPEQYQDKLRLYTGQELFYAYKIATFKPKKRDGVYSGQDMLYLALRGKLFRWLKGQDKNPIAPSAWDKLGRKFRYEFESFVEYESVEEQA